MKLWLLRPREDLPRDSNPWIPEWNNTFGFVIRAESEEQARALAITGYGWGNKEYFLDPALTTCVELSSDGEPGIIMEDFHAG